MKERKVLENFCIHCGQSFTSKRTAKFCSKGHAQAWKNQQMKEQRIKRFGSLEVRPEIK